MATGVPVHWLPFLFANAIFAVWKKEQDYTSTSLTAATRTVRSAACIPEPARQST